MTIIRIPLEKRFWRLVQKSETCWFWIGARTADGYGKIWDAEKQVAVFAHRVSWELANGKPIPKVQAGSLATKLKNGAITRAITTAGGR